MTYHIKNVQDLLDIVKQLNKSSSKAKFELEIHTRKIDLNTTLSINFNALIKTRKKTVFSTQDGSTIFSLGSGCDKFIMDGSKGKIILEKCDSSNNANGGCITASSESNQMILKNI
ncbi:MAG: hypothetical protein FJZ56_01735 [Chlamydiae bacterium]|nr:hypothetical protein [Chlamydiota bacterium]